MHTDAASDRTPSPEWYGARSDLRDGTAGPDAGRERNVLLRSIPAESYARLAPHLEPMQLEPKFVIWEPHAPIEWVYFPRTCVLSLLVPLAEDKPVEAATVGCEGFAGVPVVLDAGSAASRCIAQVPGESMRLRASVLREAAEEDRVLRRALLRYAQALYEQTSQSVACNSRHDINERCARWLLMTHDRVGGAEFRLTHEFLAMMMGVRRASVTVAEGMLQQAGLIRVSRGRVAVVDRVGLEASCCECYRIVKDRYDRLLNGGPS